MKIKCELVKVEQRETLDGKKKFYVYKTVNGKGKLIDVRFTQAVKDIPTTRGTIYGDGNVDKERQYPCVWIKSIDKFEPWAAEEEVENENPVDISELL